MTDRLGLEIVIKGFAALKAEETAGRCYMIEEIYGKSKALNPDPDKVTEDAGSSSGDCL